MKTIDVIKTLDHIAQQANSLWNQCEFLKMRIIEDGRVRPSELKKNGIFIPKAEPPDDPLQREQMK